MWPRPWKEWCNFEFRDSPAESLGGAFENQGGEAWNPDALQVPCTRTVISRLNQSPPKR